MASLGYNELQPIAIFGSMVSMTSIRNELKTCTLMADIKALVAISPFANVFVIFSKSCRNMVCVTTARLLQHLPHDDVIKWKHFPRNWPFVRGIHRSMVNSPHKGQWRGALMFSLICVWINGVNNREVGDLRRYLAHYDVIVMKYDRNIKLVTSI